MLIKLELRHFKAPDNEGGLVIVLKLVELHLDPRADYNFYL